MLIGQSIARELFSRYHLSGFRMLHLFLSYILQCTAHDFEYNRKMMLLEMTHTEMTRLSQPCDKVVTTMSTIDKVVTTLWIGCQQLTRL